MSEDLRRKRKVKPLSDHDVREVVMFQKYLSDRETMPLAKFYARYQEYMGLSDAEVAVLIERKVKA
jgi:hypothetical protein